MAIKSKAKENYLTATMLSLRVLQKLCSKKSYTFIHLFTSVQNHNVIVASVATTS
jgi:hypothetical protein